MLNISQLLPKVFSLLKIHLNQKSNFWCAKVLPFILITSNAIVSLCRGSRFLVILFRSTIKQERLKNFSLRKSLLTEVTSVK